MLPVTKKNTLIIAEAGVNHNGDIEIAKKLILEAVNAGADIVKFQTFNSSLCVTANAPKALYQQNFTDSDVSQLEMVQKLELGHDDHGLLKRLCDDVGIEFLSTAFDLPSVQLLYSLGIKRWKIPSGEITNLPYLRKIGSLRAPIILSTGMANLADIESAIDVLQSAGTTRDQITVLHCTTEYPAPLEEVNLRAMQNISHAFEVSVGYSDHTEGIAIPIAAVAMGATIIEKHFTLNRQMEGPDHRASLEPQEFAAMVQGIRALEKAYGDGIKRPTPSEMLNISVVRKSIVASRKINAGELFSSENISVKRPGTGVSPMLWDNVIGRRALHSYNQDDFIDLP